MKLKAAIIWKKKDLIKSKGLKIAQLVTDRHAQIVKNAREEMPNTKHCFDVWHVAKGIYKPVFVQMFCLTCWFKIQYVSIKELLLSGFKKKLVALSKEKYCEAIQPWIPSMCNHLYWVPASTPSGNSQLMLEKWESIVNHVQNIHEHDGQLYTECTHGTLEGRERQKKWLTPGSFNIKYFKYLKFLD